MGIHERAADQAYEAIKQLFKAGVNDDSIDAGYHRARTEYARILTGRDPLGISWSEIKNDEDKQRRIHQW